MTLVLSVGLSGLVSIISSDSRNIEAEFRFNAETGGMEAIPETIKIQGTRKKVARLNSKVMAGAGGRTILCDFVIGTLEILVREEHDLSDCKELLEEVITEAKSLNDFEWVKLFDMPGSITVGINGFYRDGSSGQLWFKSGEDAKVLEFKNLPLGQLYYGIIGPGEEYDKQLETFFDFPELIYLYSQLNSGEISLGDLKKQAFKIIQDRLITMHGVIAFNEPVKVSSDFEVHVISEESGEKRYSKKTYDCAGEFEKYSLLKKQIESTKTST